MITFQSTVAIELLSSYITFRLNFKTFTFSTDKGNNEWSSFPFMNVFILPGYLHVNWAVQLFQMTVWLSLRDIEWKNLNIERIVFIQKSCEVHIRGVLYSKHKQFSGCILCDLKRLISFELTFTILLQGYLNFNLVDVTTNGADVTLCESLQV